MKKIIFTLIVFCGYIGLASCQSETQSFNANGIKVIFKPTSKKVVNIRIYFKGGVTNYPASKAGIENITLEAVTKCGTKNYSAAAFKDTSDKYGIGMYGTSTYDYGYIQLNCIAKYFNKGWDLFSEAVMNPVFDQNEVKLLKNKVLGIQRNNESNPDYRLFELQMQSAFNNTPYSINPTGNEETVNALNSPDLSDYYRKILNKNKIFIVVVGNITKQEIFEKILYSFSNIPAMPYVPAEFKTPAFKDNTLLTEKQKLATGYVGAVMNSPDFTSVNYIPFCLGIRGLGGNLYAYLRSQRDLSYYAGTASISFKMPFALMRASSIHVQEVMDGMLKKLKEIQSTGLNDEWLQHIKNNYITKSFIDDQSASAITDNLGRAEILGGWEYADDLTKLVQMVTVEQVNNALNFYIVGLRWTYLGNSEAIENFKPPVY